MWLAQGKCTKILIYANSKQQATENLCVCAPKPRTGDYLTVMNVNDPEIIRLRETVAAAREEFDLAVIFHETWKPAAYDEDLHKRMGVSFATNAFHVVRIALRREMWLALTRLWDKRPDAVRMEFVAKTLRKPHVINALAADRATRLPAAEIQIRQHLTQTAKQAIELIDKYANDGSTRQKLQTLRHERLAHREIAAVTGISATDEEVEAFYQDISKLISLLLSLVMANAMTRTIPRKCTVSTESSFGPQCAGSGLKAIRIFEHPGSRRVEELAGIGDFP